jgi:hypothetical protein
MCVKERLKNIPVNNDNIPVYTNLDSYSQEIGKPTNSKVLEHGSKVSITYDCGINYII